MPSENDKQAASLSGLADAWPADRLWPLEDTCWKLGDRALRTEVTLAGRSAGGATFFTRALEGRTRKCFQCEKVTLTKENRHEFSRIRGKGGAKLFPRNYPFRRS